MERDCVTTIFQMEFVADEITDESILEVYLHIPLGSEQGQLFHVFKQHPCCMLYCRITNLILPILQLHNDDTEVFKHILSEVVKITFKLPLNLTIKCLTWATFSHNHHLQNLLDAYIANLTASSVIQSSYSCL